MSEADLALEEVAPLTAPVVQAAPEPVRAKLSIKKLAIRGSLWTIAGFGGGQVLRFASNLLLTRLLFPKAFGLMSLINVFMQGLMMFSDVGIGPSIVRSQRGEDHSFLNTAWTIQVVRGIVLWLCMCLLAWPVAHFYGEQQLWLIFPVLGLNALMSGFNSTSMFLAKRQLMIGRLITAQMLSQVVGICTVVAFALAYRSVWALVAGSLVSTFAILLLSHVWLPGPLHRFTLDKDVCRELFGFGKWITLSSAMFFIGSQGDRLFLGKFMDLASLGVYTVAVMLAEPFINVNTQLSYNVLYPAISRAIREDSTRTAAVFYRSRLRLDVMFLPALGLLLALGPWVVEILYDKRYVQAGWILQFLAVRAMVACVARPCEVLMVSLGKSVYAFAQHVARTSWLIIGVPLGWHFGGLHGLVWAVALSEVPVVLTLWWGLGRHRVLWLAREGLAALLAVAGFGIGFLIEIALRNNHFMLHLRHKWN
jgi:O-antigen/teichoic acid export membrane protein